MKMNRQNPGGEIETRPTMKGVEKFMARGKGDIKQSGYHCGLQTKYAGNAPGLKGWVRPGHARGK